MSKRWKPNNSYYFIDATGRVSSQSWNDDCIDEAYYEFGNCFDTEFMAKTAAAKVKSMLLSLHGEPVTDCNQLPKLTEEVFNRPDCPKGAKIAVVDEDGRACWGTYETATPENGGWTGKGSGVWEYIPEKFEASDWTNSLIERPVELPVWCEVDAIGWHKRCGYFKVTYIDDVSKRVDIQQIDDKSRGYFSFHTVHNEIVQAHLRPYNAEEMRGLVGKVLEYNGHLDLVISYDRKSGRVYLDSTWMSADEILFDGYTIDGELCGVLEHLEEGAWVK